MILLKIFYYWSYICWWGLLIFCVLQKRWKLGLILFLGLSVKLFLSNSSIESKILGLEQWISFLFSIVSTVTIGFHLVQDKKFKFLGLFLIFFLVYSFGLLYFLRGLSGRVILFPEKLPFWDVRLNKSVSYRTAAEEKILGPILQSRTVVKKALESLNFNSEGCNENECSFRSMYGVGIRFTIYQSGGENKIAFEIASEDAGKLREYKKDNCLSGKLKDQLTMFSKSSQAESTAFQCVPSFGKH